MRGRAGALALTTALLAGGCGGAGHPTRPSHPVTYGLLQVETVEVLVAESLPPRVSLRVRGILGDGCTSLDGVRQRRDGNAFTVTIATVRRGAVCIQIAQFVEVPVVLAGPFPPGDYLVRVNGVEARFRI